jgi:hypothetical protein
MKPWEKDKRDTDKYLPEIKRIIGEYLISEPPIEEDAERNTDLIVLKLDAIRIACRIRKYNYYNTYADEFTLRSGRPSGVLTELAKVVSGWGNYFFYGFANENETRLYAWGLADLNIFRLWYMQQIFKNSRPGILQNNKDNSSQFMAFKWQELPTKFIVASNNIINRKAA